MSSKKNAVLSGIAALLVAASILAVSVLTGFPFNPTNSGAPSGTLSVLLTDPPHVPTGVSAVSITYSDVAVHVSEAGNQSGWTIVKSSGTIELMSTVNVAQTISSVKITSGDYNALRFNISSAQVTYYGKTYTAFVPSSRLIVPIIGGIEVNASKPSATIINIDPTVFNIGSTSNPEFIIRPAARAFPVPSSEVTEQVEHEGNRLSLAGRTWWMGLLEKYTENAQVTNANLTPSSLSVTVKNTGTLETKLRLVVVAPIGLTSVAAGNYDRPPATLFGAAVFIALPNATLVPIQKYILSAYQQGTAGESLMDAFASGGYSLTAGSSGTVSYKGTITLGFHLSAIPTIPSIVPGQQYQVTVLGDEALASQVLVAGQ